MITIIGTPGKYISLSAPRETHLKELEAFARRSTGIEYIVDSSPYMVISDFDKPANLIWTLIRDRRQYIREENKNDAS